jgi:hypothetical protein
VLRTRWRLRGGFGWSGLVWVVAVAVSDMVIPYFNR